MAKASKGDIKLYKGVFLERIVEAHNERYEDNQTDVKTLDAYLKFLLFGDEHISIKDISHEDMQNLKENVKYFALNRYDLDLDDNDDIKFNWR